MSPATPPSTQSDDSQSPPDLVQSRSSRRAFLGAVGTATATALAGCNALSDDLGGDSAPFHDGDWHSFGNGPTNTNRVAGGAPVPVESRTLTTGEWPYTPPVVHAGIVYVATDQRVVATSVGGDERWTRELNVEVAGAPALDPERDRLHVPTRVVRTSSDSDPAPASVTTLSLTDGEVVGTTRVGDRRTYGVTVAAGDVFARSATACVRLTPDGTERWRYSLDPLVYDKYNLGDSTATQISPAVAGDGVYVPDQNALVKLDRETGEERWRISVDTPYAASVVDDETVVQTGWQETIAVARSGEVRWRRDLSSRAAAAIADGDVYVVAGDLYELDAATGETNWQTHLPNEGTAAPVVTDEHVLAATGEVRAFRRDIGGIFAPDREQWRVSSIHAVAYSSPVVAAERIFVVSPVGLRALRTGQES